MSIIKSNYKDITIHIHFQNFYSTLLLNALTLNDYFVSCGSEPPLKYRCERINIL